MSNVDLDVRAVMLQQEREARDIQELKESISKILAALVNHNEIPEWLTLEQAVKLKGGSALNTVKNNIWLRPGAINPQLHRYCGGRLVYNRDEVVLPWLRVTDENLRDYITHTCGISSIPAELEAKLRKAEMRIGVENA